MSERPKRKQPPLGVKATVLRRALDRQGAGPLGGIARVVRLPLYQEVPALEAMLREVLGTERIQYDHRPPLADRDVNAEGTDYIPPQLDPEYIEAVSVEEHGRRTNGTKATTLNSDTHRRKKLRSLTGQNKPRPKRKIPSRPLRSSW